VKAVTSMEDAIKICIETYNLNYMDFSITVCAPDDETLKEVIDFDMKRNIDSYEDDVFIDILKDKGIGKPAALNMCLAGGNPDDILVLTDGDCSISKYSLRNLLNPLLRKPNIEKIGAVSGRPVSISPRNTKYGFWSHLLTDIADKVRTECVAAGNSSVCSGYLYAFKRSALPAVREGVWVDESALSDDAFISYVIEKNGYKIDYASDAQVFVKYPDNFKDWISQKARSTGGYDQLKSWGMGPANPMRSFKKEVSGLGSVWQYGVGWVEKTQIIQLIFARSMLWTRIFWERKITNKGFKETWGRIESTK
jgi:cellulose synthase/poly-beta-1,6-N-acetylglucosamine synthase-like glycosyltransferase